MNYEKHISEAYTSLQLLPRPGQVEAVDRVLTAFLKDGKRNVVLSADTGTGKSIIGAIVAMVFSKLKGIKDNPERKCAAFTLMQNNALVDQYSDTFERYERSLISQIKGASNYPCEALRELTSDKEANGESCVMDQLPQPSVQKFCHQCKFAKAKAKINATENLITNYSYYFVSKMWSQHLDPRPLTIFDEAHTLNEVFCDHNAIFISETRMEECIQEIIKDFGPLLQKEAEVFRKVKDVLQAKKINDGNYLRVLNALNISYKKVCDVYMVKASEASTVENSVKLKKVAKKYFNYGCKIGDLLNYKYEHVIELIPGDDVAFTVKPVFMGKMSEQILGEYNLFMSATISDKYIIDTLELNKDTVAFIKLPPVFPAENKTIVFADGGIALNYANMNDSKNISRIAALANAAVEHHTDQGEKGLIICPSYKVAEQMAEGIKTRKVRVFLHTRRENLQKLISDFKAYKGPAVLISPSIFEGLDFAGDYSRYQILVKAPFPSLGEERMKFIASNYGDIYRLMTLKKIIQGIGRSVRSPDDYAVTYILDGAVKRLFNSTLNVWKDQFEVA